MIIISSKFYYDTDQIWRETAFSWAVIKRKDYDSGLNGHFLKYNAVLNVIWNGY